MIGALVAGITGSGGASLSSYESIATATGTGSSGTITFSSIPGTFKHLQIRTIAYSGNVLGLRFNNDTGTNYTRHNLYGNGTSVNATGAITQSRIEAGITGYTSDYYGVTIIDILDYATNSKNKTVRAITGLDNNGTGQIQLRSGLWLNTNTVTSITLFDVASANFTTASTFALYGIKEA